MHTVGKSQAIQEHLRPRPSRGVQRAVQLKHQLHILAGGEIRHQVAGLKDEADLLAAEGSALAFALEARARSEHAEQRQQHERCDDRH